MRIALNAIIVGPYDTGVGVWVRGLVRALAGLRGPEELICYRDSTARSLQDGVDPAVFRDVALPGHLRAARVLWEQFVLRRRLRRDGADVLHCPAYVAPFRPGVPVVLTLHDLMVYTHPALCKRLNVIHYRMRLPGSIRRAAVIHCTSDWTRRALAHYFPDAVSRAHVVHPCVDDIFTPDAPPEETQRVLSDLGVDRAPFLFVGNIEPKKGLMDVLDAFESLCREGMLDRKLVVVGRPGWRCEATLARIQAMEGAGSVVRTGYVPRERLPALYRAACALLFCSHVEGFGIPPLEAMACGTPVVCSDHPALDESAGDAALRVPISNVPALKEALAEIDRDASLRRRLAAAGLERATGFRWVDTAPRFVELYRAAAG